jgi:hypothetical protein
VAQQTIGIGTVANDGTGDPARTAFDKCNDNFTELYSLAAVVSVSEAAAAAVNDAAIAASLAACAAAGGGTALIPVGTYAISAYINVPSNVTLAGAGIGITRLLVDSSSTSTHPDNGGWLTLVGVSNAHIRDLTLDLSDRGASPGNGITFTAPTSNAKTNKITYTGLTGTFSLGEYVTGSTSGARAVIVYNPTGSLNLADITGAFVTSETLTGSLSGATATSSSAVTNLTADHCSSVRCEVIGTPFEHQYLIWIRDATNIDVRDCICDGGSITETGAAEFAYSSTVEDQNGIEVFGGYNVRILNNTCRHMGNTGIGIGVWGGESIGVSNVVAQGNIIEQCSTGISVVAYYNGTDVGQLRNVLVSKNTITNSWRFGVYCATTMSASYSGTLATNVIFDGNVIDLRGSKRSATYGQIAFALFGDATYGANCLWSGCKVLNNSTYGGGGSGSGGALFCGGLFVSWMNTWEIRGNTIDSVAHSSTTVSAYVYNSNDIVFDGNTISNPGKQAFHALASLRTRFTNNHIWPAPSISGSYGTYWQQTCSGAIIFGNTFNQQGANGYYSFGGDASGTDVYMGDNVYVGTTLGVRAEALPYSTTAQVIASTVTTKQNNYAPTGWSRCKVLRWNGAGSTGITGFSASEAVDGDRKTIVNASTNYLLWLENENAESSAANRIRLPKGMPAFLLPSDSITVQYDGTSSRWRAVDWPSQGQAMGFAEWTDMLGYWGATTGGPFPLVTSGAGVSIGPTYEFSAYTAGRVKITTGSTNAGRASFGGYQAALYKDPVIGGLVGASVGVPVATDGTETFSIHVGFAWGDSATWDYAATWEYRWNGSAAELSQTVIENTSATRSTTGSPSISSPGITTRPYHLLTYLTPSWDAVDFIYSTDGINYVLASRVSAGLPTSRMAPSVGITKTNGTTERIAVLDWLGWRLDSALRL